MPLYEFGLNFTPDQFDTLNPLSIRPDCGSISLANLRRMLNPTDSLQDIGESLRIVFNHCPLVGRRNGRPRKYQSYMEIKDFPRLFDALSQVCPDKTVRIKHNNDRFTKVPKYERSGDMLIARGKQRTVVYFPKEN
jgi:hypothetical protein